MSILEPTPPTGTLTLMLTDVVGSTRLWEEQPDAMLPAMKRHHEILHEQIDAHEGYRPSDQGEGDSVFAVFARARDAVACALEAQKALVRESWPGGLGIEVRMALYSGDVELRDGSNYSGQAISRCSRLRDVAHGGQVVLSRSTFDLVADSLPDGAAIEDLGSHRLRDLSRPEHIFQLKAPGLTEGFPPPASLESFRHNLPVQLTSFIGREREVAQVVGLIDEHRLVTLTGAAGCGKTRLALQVAAASVERFHDGVWFVDLSRVMEPGLVAGAAAQALGLLSGGESAEEPTRAGGPGSTESLVGHFRSKRSLLVLDNCEHVIAAAADLSDVLLRSCPDLRIATTSREPLGVPGETSFRVPSFRLPDVEKLPEIPELMDFEAIALFVERARLGRPGFELSGANALAVAQICTRLDGIPLPIELAAARVRSLSPAQISDHLDDAFKLLTGGSRTVMERQQTMRAAIDWSHRLLTQREQVLFRRLSAFMGTFTLDAVETVAAGEEVPSVEVLDLLTQLVDKSLVQQEDSGEEVRYRLLEAVRQFAREKLLDSGEVARVRECHLDYYRSLMEEAARYLEGPHATEWLGRLEPEQDNVRAALDWALGQDLGEEALLIASAMTWFWWLRGDPLEGRRRLQAALEKAEGASPEVRMRGLWAHGWLNPAGGEGNDPSIAVALLEVAREVGSSWGESRAHLYLGENHFAAGQLDEAMEHLRDAAEMAEASGDGFGAGWPLAVMAAITDRRGDVDQAMKLARRSYQQFQKGGSLWGKAVSSLFLSEREARRRNLAEAAELAEEGLRAYEGLGARHGSIGALTHVATLLQELGDDAGGDTALRRALELARDLGSPVGLLSCGRARARRGDWQSAVELIQEAVEAARLRTPTDAAQMLWALAWYQTARGEPESAVQHLDEAEPHILELSRPHFFLTRARTLWKLGKPEEARRWFEISLELLRRGDFAGDAPWTLDGLAAIALDEGDQTKAKRFLIEAVDRAQQGGNWPAAIQGTARFASRVGNHDAAVRLLASLSANRDPLDASWPPLPVDLQEHQGWIRAAEQSLGGAGFRSDWSEGEQVSREDASRLARELLEA